MHTVQCRGRSKHTEKQPRASNVSSPLCIEQNYALGGMCTRCGQHHSLPATADCLLAAKALCESLDVHKRFDFEVSTRREEQSTATLFMRWLMNPPWDLSLQLFHRFNLKAE